jgi:hypothetical protein
MLSDEALKRAARKVKEFTEMYTTTKRKIGYNVTSVGLPTFDSQDDFDGCRPEDKGKGKDFREHNEFIAEVVRGMLANGVPAEPVLLRYSEFARWLNGRAITNENRSEYIGHLGAEAGRKKKKP